MNRLKNDFSKKITIGITFMIILLGGMSFMSNIDAISISILKQYDAGTPIHDLVCKNPTLTLAIRENGKPVCASENLIEKLGLIAYQPPAISPDEETDTVEQVYILPENSDKERNFDVQLEMYLEKTSLEHMDKRIKIQNLVASAISLYDEIGVDSFEKFNSDEIFHDGELYIFVNNYDDNTIVAHGVNASLVGIEGNNITGINGENIGNTIHDNAVKNGAWIHYMWEEPISKDILPKTSWLVLHDGYIFGSGMYDHVLTLDSAEDEKIMMVQNIVSNAISLYDSEDVNAFEIITSKSTDLQGDMYPFVISLDGIIKAHGANSERVGMESVSIHDADVSYDEIQEILKNNKSLWVKYSFVNLQTNIEQEKRALLVLHDEYIFGSGYYLD